jgi:hypothetical protein
MVTEAHKIIILIIVLLVGAVALISVLFVALSSASIIYQPSTITTEITPPVRDLSQYGTLTNLSAVPPSIEIINLNSSTLSSFNLSLVQVRENGAFQVYNSTGATSFIPYWTQNFTLLVEAEGRSNYSYPFNRTPETLEQFCNSSTKNGPTGCTMLTTITQSRPNILVTNFTLPDGGKGWAYQDFLTFWVNGTQYSINSAGMTPAQVIQIAETMEPVSVVFSG